MADMRLLVTGATGFIGNAGFLRFGFNAPVLRSRAPVMPVVAESVRVDNLIPP